MSKISIDSSIWENNSFDLKTGLTFLFLISNGIKSNKIGCFSISKKIISFYTNLSIQEIEEAFEKLKIGGLIDYDGLEVLITNASNDWTSSPQFIKSLYKETKQIKSDILKRQVLLKIKEIENKNTSFNKTRNIVYQKFQKRCAYCGKNIEYKTFHIDHIKPRKSGGDNKLYNYNPSCAKCNLEKANRTIEEYRFFLDKTMKHKFFFEVI